MRVSFLCHDTNHTFNKWSIMTGLNIDCWSRWNIGDEWIRQIINIFAQRK